MPDILQIPDPPKSAIFHAHVWVDYVELLCLANLDRQVSKADVLDRVRDTEDENILVQNDNAESSEPLSAAEEDDKWSVRASDWFSHLEYRAEAFYASYPFYLNDSQDVLRLCDDLSLQQRLYIFLLLASNLRYVGRENWSTLTSDFEILSCEVLKNCLPPSAEAHVFGANQPGRYAECNNKYEKIKQLASDINAKLLIEEHNFSTYDRGDKGLDLVGWVPTGDRSHGLLVIFGQCACTEEWEKKQYTSSDDAWRMVLGSTVRINNMAFIPICLRDADGSWHTPQDIASILIDRVRFIYLLQEQHEQLESRPSLEIINEILEQAESVF